MTGAVIETCLEEPAAFSSRCVEDEAACPQGVSLFNCWINMLDLEQPGKRKKTEYQVAETKDEIFLIRLKEPAACLRDVDVKDSETLEETMIFYYALVPLNANNEGEERISPLPCQLPEQNIK